MDKFLQEFDEILNEILIDWRGQDKASKYDTAKGSLIFIKSACLASAKWGLQRHQKWISKQIFADTADPENMEHHAWIQGIYRKAGESDAELLARDLEIRRNPPAGGNRYDYIRWAKEVDHVTDAYCIPWGQGPGSIDVVIVADKAYTGSEIASAYVPLQGVCTQAQKDKLIDAVADFVWEGGTILEYPFDGGGPVRPGDLVKNLHTGATARVVSVDSATTLTLSADIFTDIDQAYYLTPLTRQVWEHIEDVRPVRGTGVRILPVAPSIIDVDITVDGDANIPRITGSIQALMMALLPGQSLFCDQLVNLAIQGGAYRVSVISAPADDVIATTYDLLRPGNITVRKGA